MEKFKVELKQGRIAVGCIQDKGAREYQEDRYGFSDVISGENTQFTAAVADGMGGLASGAFVSEYTIKHLLETPVSPGADVPGQLCSMARRISGEIAAGGSRGGSTLAAVYCMPEGVYFCSVGDSRIYLRRGSVLTQLTGDADYFSILLDRVIDGKLTYRQAAADLDRDSLSQFIGSGTFLTPDMNIIPLAVQSGDRLLICSDGVYNALGHEELLQSLMLSAGGAAEDIYGRILARGYSNQDNFTAVVLEFLPGWSNEAPQSPESTAELFTDYSSHTSAGGRDQSEDRLFIGRGIFAAADGLGGHRNGAKAAAAAVDHLSENTGADFLPEGINTLFEGANSAVRKTGGMSAIAAAFVRDGQFTCGNVGDSRVYYFRDGRLIMQTRDHSVCQAAVELGQLDPEQVRSSEDRPKLLKVLGNEKTLNLKQTFEPIEVRSGDAFLVCTDGFWENVHEREMEADLLKSHSSAEWIRLMLKRHLMRSHNAGDNYSVICGIFTDKPQTSPKPERKKRKRLPKLLISIGIAAAALAGLILALSYLSSDSGANSETAAITEEIQ